MKFNVEEAATYAFLCKYCKEIWVMYVQRKLPHPGKQECPFCRKEVAK